MKTNNPKLIAFDMDGTLLNSKKEISFKTLHYLRKLTKQGHYIVLASGRPTRSMIAYYNQLKLKTPMICYNGAYIYAPNNNEFKPIIYEFPKESICKFLNDIKDQVINVMCEDDTDIWVDKEDRYLDYFFWYKGMNLHVGDLNKILDKNTKTCIVHTPQIYTENKEIDEAISKYPELSAHYWTGSPYFELCFKSVSKGAALLKISEFYGISKENIISFGDAENDVHMFAISGTSVIMKNSKYDIGNKAMFTSKKDNNHNGIYYELKRILKNK